jgi:serine/threonine-protein kinase
LQAIVWDRATALVEAGRTVSDSPLTLNGRYVLRALVGQGTDALVYRAADPWLGRTVAVKLLRPERCGDATARARFEREARCAGSLSHPNILAVYDYGQALDTCYLVMEYVAGGDLRRHLEAAGFLTPRAAVQLAAEIAEALGAAHGRGIVHRDVKPANVLLTDDGHAKLGDFGIARLLQAPALTASATMLGTPHYLAPEVANAAAATPAADVYAVGVILFEMLLGRRPFDGETPVQVVMQQLLRRPPLEELKRVVSAELALLVTRALAKEPGVRFPDGAALAAALRAEESTLAGLTGFGAPRPSASAPDHPAHRPHDARPSDRAAFRDVGWARIASAAMASASVRDRPPTHDACPRMRTTRLAAGSPPFFTTVRSRIAAGARGLSPRVWRFGAVSVTPAQSVAAAPVHDAPTLQPAVWSTRAPRKSGHPGRRLADRYAGVAMLAVGVAMIAAGLAARNLAPAAETTLLTVESRPSIDAAAPPTLPASPAVERPTAAEPATAVPAAPPLAAVAAEGVVESPSRAVDPPAAADRATTGTLGARSSGESLQPPRGATALAPPSAAVAAPLAPEPAPPPNVPAGAAPAAPDFGVPLGSPAPPPAEPPALVAAAPAPAASPVPAPAPGGASARPPAPALPAPWPMSPHPVGPVPPVVVVPGPMGPVPVIPSPMGPIPVEPLPQMPPAPLPQPPGAPVPRLPGASTPPLVRQPEPPAAGIQRAAVQQQPAARGGSSPPRPSAASASQPPAVAASQRGRGNQQRGRND